MSRTILLADDSVTIQKVVELTFMEEDYEVIAVGDGDAALAKLRELTPDLLIVDVHMPGADGYEVCRQVKERLPSVPVLLLVGTFESFDERQAQAIGADGSLKKPFDSRDLLEKAQELISRVGGGAASPAAGAGAAPAPAGGSPTLGDDAFEPDLDSPAFDAPGFDAPDLGSPAFEPAELEPLDLEPPPQPPPATGSVESAPLGAPGYEPASSASAAVAPAAAAPIADAAPAAGAATPTPPPALPATPGNGSLSDADVERIARRVAELVGEETVRDVAWEVVPDLAEVIIRERIRELEEQVE